jgi:hypothetical protein
MRHPVIAMQELPCSRCVPLAAIFREHEMNRPAAFVTAVSLALALAACNTVEQRVGGAAVGAGTGAVVGGPVGAVVGGAAGAVSAPTVVRATRRATR